MNPSRRTVLVASVLTLTACREKAPVRVDPDVALREAALQRELALQSAYESVMRLRPSLAPRLQALAADKAVHATALGPVTPATSAVSTVSTLAGLKALESTTATAHGRAALTASRQLAPLLASLAASSASALAVL